MNGTQDVLHIKKDEGLTFSLTINGKNIKDLEKLFDLFDFSKINSTPQEQPVEQDHLAFEDDHETPESLMGIEEPESASLEYKPDLAKKMQAILEAVPEQDSKPEPEPEVTMEMIKQACIKASKRLGSKSPVGEAIEAHFGCMLPDITPEKYREALELVESLNNV